MTQLSSWSALVFLSAAMSVVTQTMVDSHRMIAREAEGEAWLAKPKQAGNQSAFALRAPA
jgi:hypothetical protein